MKVIKTTDIMKKFLLTVLAVILGLSAASAQTSDIQDTFFGVRFGTSQEAAETILMRKDIIAISDYNQLNFYDVTLGGYEWNVVAMMFNDYGLYEVYMVCNFNSRESALSMFDGLSNTLKGKYGAAFSSDIDSWNDKSYNFTDGVRFCGVYFEYGEPIGGGMFYYVTLVYSDLNLHNKTADEL